MYNWVPDVFTCKHTICYDFSHCYYFYFLQRNHYVYAGLFIILFLLSRDNESFRWIMTHHLEIYDKIHFQLYKPVGDN